MPKKAAKPATRRQTIEGPPLRRFEAFSAEHAIVDDEARVVRVSFSSAAPVKRSRFFGEPWVEILGHDADEVDLSRLNTGAPVLYNHARSDDWSVRDTRIGVVRRAWLEGNRGHAEIQLSKRDDAAGYWTDIRDGVLRNISVGYRIHERQLQASREDSPDEYRVTRWEPMEISFVDIPADPTVGLGRSAESEPDEFRITDLEPNMATNRKKDDPAVGGNQPADTPTEPERRTDPVPEPQPAADPAPVPDAAAIRQQALAEERTRRESIRTAYQHFTWREGVDELLARQLDDPDVTESQARDALLAHLAEGVGPLAGNARIEVERDEADKRREAVTGALLVRAGLATQEIRQTVDGRNPFRGYRLLDLARDCLDRSGIRTRGLLPMDIVGRAFTQSTSDFPILLEDAMHKALQNAYALAPDTWSRFCAVGSVSDFRPHHRYRTGSIGNLLEVNENGEFRNAPIPDGEKSTVTVNTKGLIVNLTRQMIINDDLGAFMGVSANLGRASARTIEAMVYALIGLNSGLGPTQADSQPLFHANRSNVGAAAVNSTAQWDALRVLMAQQMDVGGNDFLDLRPSIWLGPIGLGGLARQVNEAQYDDESNKQQRRPNISRGLVRDIVDSPRLTGTRYYLLANPMDAPVFEVDFLDGEQRPFLDQEEGFDVDGTRYKVRLDVGVAAIDYRGAVTSAGA